MAEITIFNDLGVQDNKVCHCYYCFPIYLPWSERIGWPWSSFSECWVLNQVFHSPLSPSSSGSFVLLSFTFIKRLFSSSSLSAIRVASSTYLKLLIYLPAILIPTCASSCLAFHIMYSAYKLNKQGNKTKKQGNNRLDVLLSQFGMSSFFHVQF